MNKKWHTVYIVCVKSTISVLARAKMWYRVRSQLTDRSTQWDREERLILFCAPNCCSVHVKHWNCCGSWQSLYCGRVSDSIVSLTTHSNMRPRDDDDDDRLIFCDPIEIAKSSENKINWLTDILWTVNQLEDTYAESRSWLMEFLWLRWVRYSKNDAWIVSSWLTVVFLVLSYRLILLLVLLKMCVAVIDVNFVFHTW